MGAMHQTNCHHDLEIKSINFSLIPRKQFRVRLPWTFFLHLSWKQKNGPKRESVCSCFWIQWALVSFGTISLVLMAYKVKLELFKMLCCFGQLPEFPSTFSLHCFGWPTWSSSKQNICHFSVVPKQKMFSKVILLVFASLGMDRKVSSNRCNAASLFHPQKELFSSIFLKAGLEWSRFGVCQWQMLQ